MKYIMDIDSYTGDVHVKKGNLTIFTFSFRIGYAIDSCSLIDISDFIMNDCSYPTDNSLKVDAIQRLFKKLVRQHKSRNGHVVTILFTTIKGQELIDEAVADSKLFTLVKTFINRNTGNLNNLYISNEGTI
jgi:hypothetical protein